MFRSLPYLLSAAEAFIKQCSGHRFQCWNCFVLINVFSLCLLLLLGVVCSVQKLAFQTFEAFREHFLTNICTSIATVVSICSQLFSDPTNLCSVSWKNLFKSNFHKICIKYTRRTVFNFQYLCYCIRLNFLDFRILVRLAIKILVCIGWFQNSGSCEFQNSNSYGFQNSGSYSFRILVHMGFRILVHMDFIILVCMNFIILVLMHFRILICVGFRIHVCMGFRTCVHLSFITCVHFWFVLVLEFWVSSTFKCWFVQVLEFWFVKVF